MYQRKETPKQEICGIQVGLMLRVH